MTKYIFKKILGLIPIFIGITLLSFVVIHLAPGSVADAKASFNPKMTAQARENLEKLYGLDRPLMVQYLDWVSRLARLDLGESFVDGQAVTHKIAKALPITLLISGSALFLILLFGIPLGVYGAVKEGSFQEKIVSGLALAGFSVPTFWLALSLMSLFGVTLRWFPVSGVHSLFSEEMTRFEQVLDTARHLVLPIFVASVTGIAGISRYVRGSMSEVLRKPFIRTARAKGLPETRVLYAHALPNALLPVITILGLSLPGLLGGSVILETVFSIPGMGRLFFDSVFTRDYPVIMGLLLLGAFLTLLGNLLADLGYALADPRIRVGGER